MEEEKRNMITARKKLDLLDNVAQFDLLEQRFDLNDRNDLIDGG